jgi:hypothetical protein
MSTATLDQIEVSEGERLKGVLKSLENIRVGNLMDAIAGQYEQVQEVQHWDAWCHENDLHCAVSPRAETLETFARRCDAEGWWIFRGMIQCVNCALHERFVSEDEEREDQLVYAAHKEF